MGEGEGGEQKGGKERWEEMGGEGDLGERIERYWVKKKKKKFFFFFLVKRAGRHFGFFKRVGRYEKRAGRRALQKKPRQNTAK